LSPAWAWPLVTCFSEPVYRSTLIRRRFGTNLPLLLLGLLMPLMFYGYVSSGRGVGWFSTGWFLLVQAMSGSFGLSGPVGLTFLVAGFAMLLGVRRMRIAPVESLDVKDEMNLLELRPPFSRRGRSRNRPHKRSGPPLSPWS
jgi:hypothetical protein